MTSCLCEKLEAAKIEENSLQELASLKPVAPSPMPAAIAPSITPAALIRQSYASVLRSKHSMQPKKKMKTIREEDEDVWEAAGTFLEDR